jgi:hypothetical protein
MTEQQPQEGVIDLTDVADVLQAGDQFDVVTLDEHGMDVKVGHVITREQASTEGYGLRESLEKNMAAFHDASEQYVASGHLNDIRAGRVRVHATGRSLSQKQRKAKAAFKAQKRARRANRGR